MATPSRTATAVSAERSLRSPMLRRASAIICSALRRSRICSVVEPGPLVDDPPVGEEEDAVGDGGRATASCVTMTIVWPKSSTAWRSRASTSRPDRVEVAGRLVGEHDRRARDQRAGDRDALLLAAGELRGAVGAPVAEATVADQRLEPVAVDVRPPMRSGRSMFSSAVRTGSRLKLWKMKPTAVAAQERQLVVVERVEPRAGDLDPARRGLVEAGEDVHAASTCPSRRGP